MADPNKAPGIMNYLASLFSKQKDPQPQPITEDVRQKNRADIAKTFKSDPDSDYNSKLRKMMGLE